MKAEVKDFVEYALPAEHAERIRGFQRMDADVLDAFSEAIGKRFARERAIRDLGHAGIALDEAFGHVKDAGVNGESLEAADDAAVLAMRHLQAAIAAYSTALEAYLEVAA